MIQTVAVLFFIFVAWLAVALYLAARLGLNLHQAMLYAPLKLAYRIDDRLMRAARKAESPVIYVVVHQSRLDPMLMLSLLPAETLHILDEESARSMWLEPWRELARTIAFNAHHVFVSRRLVRHLRGRGRLAVYLPDEVEPDSKAFRLHRAVARIATKADAKIVPIFVGGSRHSWLSLAPAAIAPRKVLPKLSITALTAATLGELRDRPEHPVTTAANALFDYCASARLTAADLSRNLFAAVRDAADLYGNSRTVLRDGSRSLTYRQLLADARALGRKLATVTAEKETVGLMLPNAPALATAFLALNATGRVAAFPPADGDAASMIAGLELADIKSVLSSRRHVEQAGLADLAAALEARDIRLIWLEDIEGSTSAAERLVARKLWHHSPRRKGANRPAAVLFTKDENGEAAAVVLSDRNLLANAMQIATRLSVSPRDRLIHALPASDALGLTVGLLLPLLSGAETRFADPSANQPQGLEFRAGTGPTIIVGSGAFLAAYADAAKAEDTAGLRIILAHGATLGAEAAPLWADRPGGSVLEAFVRPETAGVIAINSLTHSRPGSAGRLLPGMQIRLEAVESMADGGRLWISGPNVMLGTLRGDAPGILQPPLAGWHDTGEAVSTDREGFFSRHGRADGIAAVAKSRETPRPHGRRAKAA
jgi:acyl-[acyl-carrier-protein]-phospholipid O-acyltransferase/long-chain-fatty-acid--[acyl-carrier-protein] ligase